MRVWVVEVEQHITHMSLASKSSVDGLEGYLFYVAPCAGKYDQVKVQLEALAKWYACCNALALLIEDIAGDCDTISLLVLVPPGRPYVVEQEERCRWIQIECLACALFRASLGVIKCSLQEPCRGSLLCQAAEPWVRGIEGDFVAFARYEFKDDDDLDAEIQRSREWLAALNQSRQLLLRVLYFVNMDNNSITFIYFFPDEAARDAFFSFLCCFMTQTVRCGCLDQTFDGMAWAYAATILKLQLGRVTHIYDVCNSNCCKVTSCKWIDPLQYCGACNAGCDNFCDGCEEAAVVREDDRALYTAGASAGRAAPGGNRNVAPAFSAPKSTRGCCGGRK